MEAEPQWKAETNKISQLDSRGRVSRIYAFGKREREREQVTGLIFRVNFQKTERLVPNVY